MLSHLPVLQQFPTSAADVTSRCGTLKRTNDIHRIHLWGNFMQKCVTEHEIQVPSCRATSARTKTNYPQPKHFCLNWSDFFPHLVSLARGSGRLMCGWNYAASKYKFALHGIPLQEAERSREEKTRAECFEFPWKNYIACVLSPLKRRRVFSSLADSLYTELESKQRLAAERHCNELEFSTWKRRESFEFSLASSMKCNSASKKEIQRGENGMSCRKLRMAIFSLRNHSKRLLCQWFFFLDWFAHKLFQ